MLNIIKPTKKIFSLFILLVALCLLVAPAADAVTYDVNAQFGDSNPNGVWTYGWASSIANLSNASGLREYTDYFIGTSESSDFKGWRDPTNSYNNTPGVYKNYGNAYTSGNIIIPAGALFLHAGGNGNFDLSVVEFTAPSAGQYSLSTSFIGRQYYIEYGHVYILDNGTTIFEDGSTIQTVGDTVTYSIILNLLAGERIDFVIGRDIAMGPDSIELQATITYNPVPLPGAVWLLGSGLLGLGGLRRFRKS